MIRVLVVDDHTIFRSGVGRLLQDEPDMRIAAEAQNGAEALEQVRGHAFDVVLLDINMEGRSGLEVLASMRALARCPPVLVLSMYPEEQYALVAVQAGASGYLAKDSEPAELVRAIRTIAGGGQYLSARMSGRVQDQLRGLDDRPPHQRLSVREHQIMLMTIRGMSVTDIAEEMMISVKTVSTHRANLLAKLGLGSTAELVLYAVRQGLVH
ncbi:response regulator [Piscinibacter terrae]|uniref:DNA-binding response regulator n=1 Tax=Piscinibacter terrae TaxID=2496871 RepID=A0A3N7JWX6_9BURK|nr:response regulator transcription factor [Albitalea terrae]RQP23375.1 DNA-binding response regulator [Albitalea terrae]